NRPATRPIRDRGSTAMNTREANGTPRGSRAFAARRESFGAGAFENVIQKAILRPGGSIARNGRPPSFRAAAQIQRVGNRRSSPQLPIAKSRQVDVEVTRNRSAGETNSQLFWSCASTRGRGE